MTLPRAPQPEEHDEIVIKYLDGAFGKKGELPSLIQQKAIDFLAAGDDKQAQLEMLTNSGGVKIFSIAYSYAGRLLLIPEDNGWVILEDIPDHNYDRARFMNPAVLARLLKSEYDLKATEAATFDLHARPLTEEERAALPKLRKTAQSTKVVFKPVVYIKNQFSTLSEAQTTFLEILKRVYADLPLKVLLSGSPGAGKTSLLWQAMEDGISQNLSNFIYIAPNSVLIDSWNDQAESSPVLANHIPAPGKSDWLFSTPLDWLREICPELQNLTVADGKTCFTWLGDYFSGHRSEDIPASLIARKKEIYPEFKNLSGHFDVTLEPNDENQPYLNVGEYNCSFPQREEQLFLLKLYALYQLWLKKRKMFDPDLYHIPDIEKVRDIFPATTKITYLVDEGQQLSTLLAKLIIKASKGRIILSYDDRQRRSDPISKRVFFERELGEGLIPLELPASFRCYENVIVFLNRLVQLILKVTHGKTDKAESTKVNSALIRTEKGVGEIRIGESELTQLKADYKSTTSAILTHEDYCKEARVKFGDAYEIYSYEQMPSAEFDRVIFYRPFAFAEFRELSKSLAEMQPTDRVNTNNLAKNLELTYLLALHDIYVGASRCFTGFVIYETSGKPVRHLIKELFPETKLEKKKKKETPATLENKAIAEEAPDYEAMLGRAKFLLFRKDPGQQVPRMRALLPEALRKRLDDYARDLEKKRAEQQLRANAKREKRAQQRTPEKKESVATSSAPRARKPTFFAAASSPMPYDYLIKNFNVDNLIIFLQTNTVETILAATKNTVFQNKIGELLAKPLLRENNKIDKLNSILSVFLNNSILHSFCWDLVSGTPTPTAILTFVAYLQPAPKSLDATVAKYIPLTTTTDGIQLFTKAVQASDTLGNFLTNPDALARAIPKPDNAEQHTCLYQALRVSPKGSELLDLIMGLNPYTTSGAIQVALINQSLPFCVRKLALTPEEQKQLDSKLNAITEGFTVENFIDLLEEPNASIFLFKPNAVGARFFHLFFNTPTGATIALQAFTKRPDLLAVIPLEKLFERFIHNKYACFTSCAAPLFTSPDGNKLLTFIFERRGYNLPQQVMEFLIANVAVPEFSPNYFFPIDFLLANNNLSDLRLELAKKNDLFINVLATKQDNHFRKGTLLLTVCCFAPELIPVIIARLKYTSNTEATVRFKYLFHISGKELLFFHWTAKCPALHPLLDEIANDKNIITMLTPITPLGIEMSRSQNDADNSHPMLWLAQTPEGCSVLRKLFIADTGNKKHVTLQKALKKKLNLPGHPSHNRNTLQILIHSDHPKAYLCLLHLVYQNDALLFSLDKDDLKHYQTTIPTMMKGLTLTEAEEKAYSSTKKFTALGVDMTTIDTSLVNSFRSRAPQPSSSSSSGAGVVKRMGKNNQ